MVDFVEVASNANILVSWLLEIIMWSAVLSMSSVHIGLSRLSPVSIWSKVVLKVH